MFNRSATIKRLKEIGFEVEAKMADPNLTTGQKSAYLRGAEAEAGELNKALENLDRAKQFRAGSDVNGPDALGNVDSGKRLSFKGMSAGLAGKMLADDGLGQKALAPSGAAAVGQQFVPDPVALGRVATSLLDVLPVYPHGTAEYAYLRQSVRTNNAAVVADGATKPTSVYTVARVEQSLVVIAHLSEGVPRYWLLDNTSLQAFVDAELMYGLRVAVEAKVMADINGTSGIQTQAYSTSVLQTLRKSLTKLEISGLAAAALVLHPSDWEGVELALSSTNAIEHMSLPYDPATRRLFGVPVVTSTSQAAGVSHAIARDAVGVDVDSQGIQLQWSENSNATDFQNNLIRARCEGRYGTSVFRPLGIVVGDLTP
jgi:HK97 family phage major capsid protein